MKTANEIVAELRADIDMTDQQAAQIMYEQWLKEQAWVAREEGLPLIVGVDPNGWQTYLSKSTLHPQEELLWHILANDLSV
ncbi:MAG: hypothetical protein AAF387_08480, partial [Pseudomonadota bacterium]